MKNARVTSGVTRSPYCESSILGVGDNVRWRQENGGLILYDVEHDIIYRGNHMTFVIVEQCNGQNTIRDIATYLTSEYRIPYCRALVDVREIIEQMHRWALLEKLV